MALFESYERRIDTINKVLNSYGISSIEEAKKLCSLVFADTIREVKIEEEKKNADGYIETAYKFSCTKQEGMMWENESVGYFPNLVKK